MNARQPDRQQTEQAVAQRLTACGSSPFTEDVSLPGAVGDQEMMRVQARAEIADFVRRDTPWWKGCLEALLDFLAGAGPHQ
jgi:hypothetical protein